MARSKRRFPRKRTRTYRKKRFVGSSKRKMNDAVPSGSGGGQEAQPGGTGGNPVPTQAQAQAAQILLGFAAGANQYAAHLQAQAAQVQQDPAQAAQILLGLAQGATQYADQIQAQAVHQQAAEEDDSAQSPP